jgi:peptide deformylase
MLDIIQLSPSDFNSKTTVLREKSLPVTDFGGDFQKEVDSILETFHHWKISVGLSAPQVGIKKRLAAINISKGKTEPTLVIVNPIITNSSGKKDIKKESCLSLPQVRGDVERRYKLSIMYQDRNGKKQTLSAEGFYARVILHEIDHLDGILFVDRMDNESELETLDIPWE